MKFFKSSLISIAILTISYSFAAEHHFPNRVAPAYNPAIGIPHEYISYFVTGDPDIQNDARYGIIYENRKNKHIDNRYKDLVVKPDDTIETMLEKIAPQIGEPDVSRLHLIGTRDNEIRKNSTIKEFREGEGPFRIEKI